MLKQEPTDLAPATAAASGRAGRHRGGFYAFAAMNTFSFMLLSGSVVVLCAMMLGASGTYIGLLGALNFITYFFMPLGRLAIRNQPIIKVFGWSWLIRYWSMVPAALSPLLMLAGWNRLGLALLLIGSLGFNIFRGIGLIGNNPLLAHLAGKKNRGQFFSNIQIANSLTAIAASAASVAALRWIRDGWAFGAMTTGRPPEPRWPPLSAAPWPTGSCAPSLACSCQ